jgi:ribosomal protein S10
MKGNDSKLKITSFHKKYLQNFIQKLKILCYNKYLRNFLIYKGSKTIKKKHTLLKSPHVNKKARDQIEIQHISHFFKITNGRCSRLASHYPLAAARPIGQYSCLRSQSGQRVMGDRKTISDDRKTKNNFNFLFFILNFKTYNNTSLALDYIHSYKQKIFFLLEKN